MREAILRLEVGIVSFRKNGLAGFLARPCYSLWSYDKGAIDGQGCETFQRKVRLS